MRYVALSLPSKAFTFLLVAGSSTLGLGACGKLPGFAVDATTNNFDQLATINNKIDILFVVDNSGSMAEEQANLAQSFTDFITKFGDRKLDFQVGVVSTDPTVSTSYWAATGSYTNSSPYKNFANAGSGTLLAYKNAGVANAKIITPNTPNYIDQFKQNVTLGTNGSGAETGLLSVLNFLTPAFIAKGGWNEGFIREGALLSVIFLSDEDESRGLGSNANWYLKEVPADQVARATLFKTAVAALKPANSNLLRVDAIVAPSKAECPTVGTDGNNMLGTGDSYIEVAAFFKGETHNICKNFSNDLLQIGGDLISLLSRFKLAQKPDGQIEVRVNGVLVVRDASNGWEYLADTQEVEFRGDAVPAADAKISVTYIPGEPLQ